MRKSITSDPVIFWLSTTLLFMVLLNGGIFLSRRSVLAPGSPVLDLEKYKGVNVSELSVEEQIKIARCVERSSVVNWGEGGPAHVREVAEAFLLGYPYPGFIAYLEEKHGVYHCPGWPQGAEPKIAFLTQRGTEARTAWIYLASDVAYQIAFQIIQEGDVWYPLKGGVSFTDGSSPFAPVEIEWPKTY